MICLVLVSLLIITSYKAAVCIKGHGVPSSISATFYALDHKLWFGATMWLTAGLLMPAILEISTENSEWAAFLACVGMMLVGVAPNFKEDFDGDIHTTGATMCLLFSQVWVGFNNPWLLLAWLVYLTPTAILTWRNYQERKDWRTAFLMTKPMFWVEIVALATTYMTVLSHYLGWV